MGDLKQHCKAALLAAALAVSSPSQAAYTLSDLEHLLVDAISWEQIDSFLKTGISPFFENPTVLYRTRRTLYEEFSADAGAATARLKDGNVVVETSITRLITDGDKRIYQADRPKLNISLEIDSRADTDELDRKAVPGKRYAFCCTFKEYRAGRISFDHCLPLEQYLKERRDGFYQTVDKYLKGEVSDNPNLANYAMLVYMAVVSAEALPANSSCRSTVNDEAGRTLDDVRICSQEVQKLWAEMAEQEEFAILMDKAELKLKNAGVDTSILNKASTAED